VADDVVVLYAGSGTQYTYYLDWKQGTVLATDLNAVQYRYATCDKAEHCSLHYDN